MRALARAPARLSAPSRPPPRRPPRPAPVPRPSPRPSGFARGAARPGTRTRTHRRLGAVSDPSSSSDVDARVVAPPPARPPTPPDPSRAFCAFCDAALARPGVARGLRAFEARHPEVDRHAVLLAFWHASLRPRASLTRAQIRAVARGGERWRWRVNDGLLRVAASLRGPDLEDEPAALELARAAEALEREASRVARRRAANLVASWSAAASVVDAAIGDVAVAIEGREEEIAGSPGPEPRAQTQEARDAADAGVGGAAAIACVNLRLYFEYQGLRPTRADWGRHLRDVFEGCAAVGGFAEEGLFVIDEGVSSSSASDASRRDAAWARVREATEASTRKPRALSPTKQAARYHAARRNLREQNRRWAAAKEDYKNARFAVKRARHEVDKTRKHVRTEFR
jgi:hypothetical protein